MSLPIEIFSTCPPSHTADPETYLQRVGRVARSMDDYGYKGILVYTDNSMVDPWLVSQVIVQNTIKLCPLVAVQPIYMHPYSVAKMVASFGFLYRRRLYLNMVAGGFVNDLAALDDLTPHDKRYARLTEYTAIIKRLLASGEPVTFHGEFYKVDKLSMKPALPPELFPGIFISGSSEAGLEAAKALGATAVAYPKPPNECCASSVESIDSGIRVGIIARQNEADAWSVAESRFPEDRMGNLTHQLAMKVSDSLWHRQLAQAAGQIRGERSTYWLRPFENYKTFCPYLVGSYDAVAEDLAKYAAHGYRKFILDVPPDEEELLHTGAVFDRISQTSSTADSAIRA